jgi:hypothetical protein
MADLVYNIIVDEFDTNYTDATNATNTTDATNTTNTTDAT